MLEDMNAAIESYRIQWSKLIATTNQKDFFEKLKPTAIGWKAKDLEEFDTIYKQLRGSCDQIHSAWLNERWLTTMHLRDTSLSWGISVIKLMQRRPNSTDTIGLDHVDFYTSQPIEPVMNKETILKWTQETNNPLCSWISIWFGGTEAKLRQNSVLDVCIAEMRQTRDSIIGK